MSRGAEEEGLYDAFEPFSFFKKGRYIYSKLEA